MALHRSIRFVIAFAGLAAATACEGISPARQAVTVLPPPPPPPTAMQAPQMAPQQPQMAPMQAAPPAAPAPRTGNGMLAGHLASYRTAESAQTGWQQLMRRQPALQTLKPYFLPATVNGQPWVRLLAGDFPNAEEVNRFCNWARAQSLYCVPMTIAGGQAMPAATAAPRPQRQPRGTPQPAAPAAAPAPAQSMMTPAQPAPAAAAPAAVAPPPPAMAANPAPQANPALQPPQPLAPPLPPRRQPGQPALPQ